MGTCASRTRSASISASSEFGKKWCGGTAVGELCGDESDLPNHAAFSTDDVDDEFDHGLAERKSNELGVEFIRGSWKRWAANHYVTLPYLV